MNELRMAVIGIKGVGRGHVEAIATDQRAELVALADLDQSAMEVMAAEHSTRAYTDYRRLLEREEIDAVVIATPHHLHAPMCLEALAAGAHVYLEKPIANRVSDADRVVASAQEKGLVVAVGHQYRTFPGNVMMKEIVDSGLIGDLNRILWQWMEARPETYYDRDIWRCTWKHAGGGVLMNQTSHDLDLLCWLAGDPVEVSAMIRNWGHRHQVEDTAVASIGFASGALANVQLSTCSHTLNYRQIAGDQGMILFQDETTRQRPRAPRVPSRYLRHLYAGHYRERRRHGFEGQARLAGHRLLRRPVPHSLRQFRHRHRRRLCPHHRRRQCTAHDRAHQRHRAVRHSPQDRLPTRRQG